MCVVMANEFVCITLFPSNERYLLCEIPLSEKLNPLRYQVTFFPFQPIRYSINMNGKWNTKAKISWIMLTDAIKRGGT